VLSSISGSSWQLLSCHNLDMKTSLVLAGWILTSYQLVQTIVMPLGEKSARSSAGELHLSPHAALFRARYYVPAQYLSLVVRVIQALAAWFYALCCRHVDEFRARQRIRLFSSIFPSGQYRANLGGWMVEDSVEIDLLVQCPLGIIDGAGKAG
jgi:hypothetical protein